MPSFSCWIQMLRPGIQTLAHRHVGSVVYHVHEGHGETINNGTRFVWAQGDMFVVPSWAWHEHHNASTGQRAVLFSVRDTPALVALGKYREQAYTEPGGHQQVIGDFDPRIFKQ